MKKTILAALMVLSTSAAFAGDSEPLKAILKAKTYDAAKALVEQNLSSLASDEERAKAYNKLVDLALEKVNKEQTIQLENQAAQQMGQAGDKPVDEEGLYQATANAMAAAMECNKYDQMPNAKGKVAPKFASKNADRLYNIRNQFINGGIFYQNKNDNDNAYKFLASYVDTADLPIFAKFNKAEDANLTNIAYYATIYAYQAKDWKNAERYVEYALKDPEKAKEALGLKFGILGAQLETHADSVAYAKKLEDMYAQDSNNDDILSFLTIIYSQLGQEEKAIAMLDSKLAGDPANHSANSIKGQLLKQKEDYDNAIVCLEKALPSAPNDQVKCTLNAALGECYFFKAQERVNNYKGVLSPAAREQFNVVYNKAIEYLEEARNLDLTGENKRLYAYPLYGAYYFVKGAEASETKAAAALAGVTQ